MPFETGKSDLESFKDSLIIGIKCKCPKCHQGDLYKSWWDLDVQDNCPECGLDLTKGDTADGPAVFLIFILGFLVIPLALWMGMKVVDWPLWLHAVVWTILMLVLTAGSLKPIKAYIIALQYKHRTDEME